VIVSRDGHDVSIAHSYMTHPRDYLPGLDRIEDALEASCGALVALESIACPVSDRAYEPDGIQEHVGQAIRSLRQAIEVLRSAHSDGVDGLAMGFVLKRSESAARDGTPEVAQSKPRRTA
jgi:hypothetical protein